MRRPALLIAAVSLGTVVAACGDDGPITEAPSTTTAGGSSSESSSAAPDGPVEVVHAIDNTFRADTIEVVPGTSVRWENLGRNEHDVVPVSADGWGVDADTFVPGASYSHVFTTPGEYAYYCSLHGNENAGMVGKVVVTEK